MGRFISSDGLLDTSDLVGCNTFAYCGNNPISREDGEGNFWDVVFDIASIAYSAYQVIKNPSSVSNWVSLAVDVVCAVVPFATGGGAAVRTVAKVDDVVEKVKTVNKVADVVDTTYDIAKTANRVENVIDTSTNGIRYTDKVIKQMNNAADLNHAFPSVVDTFVDISSGRPFKGGDGIVRNLIELSGSVNNTPGVFEYIIEPSGVCNHRYFRRLM